MESSVSRRETIVTRGEFQQKIPQNKAIMQSTIQKKITDLQRKIRESTQVNIFVHKNEDLIDIFSFLF
jgi:hypothetical protein